MSIDISNNYYKQLNVTSNISDDLIKKINETPEEVWNIKLEQNLISLTINDFQKDPKIYQFIKDIGDVNRLSIFRFFGNECYNWHNDSIRAAALNMVISGFNSMCIFGKFANNRRLVNVSKLQHEPNQYYIMNVKQMHTVYNFGNDIRYILSLGLPNTSYADACEYLHQHDLLLNK